MPTLAIKTIKNRRNASGNINICISLTFKREIRYIPTGFEIDDEAEFEDSKVCYRRNAAKMNHNQTQQLFLISMLTTIC